MGVLGQDFVCNIDDVLQRKVEDEGWGALEPTTIPQMFEATVEKYRGKPSVNTQETMDSEFEPLLWEDYHSWCKRVAKALIANGIGAHDTISILGFNSLEWFSLAMGTMMIGGVVVGLYPTNGPDACAYVMNHSESKIVFVENQAHLARITSVKDDISSCKKYVIWREAVPEDKLGLDIITFEEFMNTAESIEDEMLQTRSDAVLPGQCASLVYTSGTTGMPKAVMLSHDNLTWMSANLNDWLMTSHTDRLISFLPLSHVAGFLVDIVGMLGNGFQMYFAQPDALKGSLSITMKKVKPTIFLAVPRVWEKMETKMKEMAATRGAVSKWIGGWAKGVGLAGTYSRIDGKKPGFGFGIADSLVFSKVKAALGLDKCWMMVSSAAPISISTVEYFYSLNMPIMEVLGASEASAIVTSSNVENFAPNLNGPCFRGSDVLINNPDDKGEGEIIYKGRNTFMGYLKDPDVTAQSFNENGYFLSGDLGKFEENGFLRVMGRAKELIITAGGENIPPVLIEDRIRALAPFIGNMMLVGDAKPYLSLLVTFTCLLNEEGLPLDTLDKDSSNTLTRIAGKEIKTLSEAGKDEEINKALNEALKEYSQTAISRAQHVQKVKIVTKDFSVIGGELTPTLKIKRRIISQNYAEEINTIYA
eukprot:TRINITY_DN5151_c0_g1_i1.p1 TRINITY_DN5151_c0_g1~~TRINITY_DN5151_c0_g1_i1.p1  ORF type:complete len:647 (+),score=194.99 TRINITY_DN5151_c0_g1_i1:75-2015(+)